MNPESIDWISVCKILPSCMIITDNQNRIEHANDPFVKLLGFDSNHQLKNRHLQDFCEISTPSDDHLRYLRSNTSKFYELTFFNQVNKASVALSTTFPVEINGESGFLVWVINDISRYKNASDLLQTRLVESESANNSKTFFMANISHGIRSHLNSILGLYQLVKERAEKLDIPREIEQYINGIQFSAQQLQLLVNSILDLTAIEKGRLTDIQPSAFHVEQFMQSIFELFKDNAAEKSLWFTFEVSASTPKYIRADRRILSQILTNLVDNAIKFTSKGNAVKLSVYTASQRVVFQVYDEGIGIDNQFLNGIFNLYDPARTGKNANEKEAGLGLTIVNRLAQLIEGEISVSSKPGEGSVFTFEIPLYEVEANSTLKHKENRPTSGFSENNRILVIEDDKMNNEVYQAWFEDYAFEATFADNGESGLQAARKSNFNLIITDIHLPGIDGIETIKRLREIQHHQHTPIVVISASTFTDKRGLAFDAGCNEYFVKPIDLHKLRKIMETYLDKVSTDQQNRFLYPEFRDLPPGKKEELLNHYNLLNSSSVVHLEKIVNKIGEIKSIFTELGYDGPSFLDLVETAAFEGDEDKVRSLTHEAISHYYY